MKYTTDKLVIFDLEIYRNYNLFGAIFEDKVVQYTHEEIPVLKRFLEYIHSRGYTLCGFNSINYDAPVLHAMLESKGNPKDAFNTSCRIINDGEKYWNLPGEIQTVDLMNILPGRISLKKVGVILAHKKLQELPIPWDQPLSREEMEIIAKYNINDLVITNKLRDKLQSQLDLRADMSEQYGMDLRSKGEAAIAETVLLAEAGLNRREMQSLAQAKLDNRATFRIQPPSWWDTLTTKVNLFRGNDSIESVVSVGEDVFAANVPVYNGQVDPAIFNRTVYLGGKYYTMGVGGLHSVDGAGCYEPSGKQILVDIDVASYYPNIILTQKLEPEFWGAKFLPTYASIVKRRLKAKREGDSNTAAVLKIVANGTYGKFGDQFSALYDPEMLAHVTLYGQLGLLALIAMIDDDQELGNVVSANTDGITVLTCARKRDSLYSLVHDWEALTSLEMEFTEYKGLYQLDVNNYIAHTQDGFLKTKGRFLSKRDDLRHMPSALIIAKAIGEYIQNGTPLAETIHEETDLHMFLFCASVTGSWKTSFGDTPLGKILRFYKSKEPNLPPIMRTPTSDTVKGREGRIPDSENCRPVENLPDFAPEDLDRWWYVEKASSLLQQIMQPKMINMNRYAQELVGLGLMPTVVEQDTWSRAAAKWGETDFNSIPKGKMLAIRTGKDAEILARMRKGVLVELYRVPDLYPGRTRDKVLRDEGFELRYGASVPVPPWACPPVIQASPGQFDKWYTEAELRKVRCP